MRLRAGWRPAPATVHLPSVRWSLLHTATLLFLVGLLVRLPLSSDFAANWDSVQFALATERFDLEAHRPHPPGYIGYVAMGELLNLVTGDANTSFVLISLIAGALAAVLFLLLALQMLPRPRAYAATILFASSPLLWLYSGAGLTYAVETALACGFGYAAWRAYHQPGGWLLVASLALAALGAVRQTGFVLLLPLWLWAAWPATGSQRIRGGTVLAAASLAWLVPLLWLAGGPAAYLRELDALSEVTTTATSLWAGTDESIRENRILVGVSLAATLGTAVLLIPASLWLLVWRARAKEILFLALWLLPALTLFLAMHMGQAGYILVLAPPLFLIAAKALPQRLTLGTPAALLLSAAVAVNALAVFALPSIAYRSYAPDSEVAIQLRQHVPSLNDHHWREVTSFIAAYEPNSTAILSAISGPKSDSSYRHAMYYLPDYTVYGVGLEWGVRLGHLYTARHREDDYSISRPNIARDILPIPANVKTLVIADSRVMSDFRFDLPFTRHRLSDGTSIWTAPVSAGTTLIFGAFVDGKMRIEAVTEVLQD